MKKRGVLTERERRRFIYPLVNPVTSQSLNDIERTVLLAAVRLLGRIPIGEAGVNDCVRLLRARADELKEGR